MTATFSNNSNHTGSNFTSSSDAVVRLYRRRQSDFMSTLEKVLQSVATDKIVRQMLANRTSGQFISRRIEELLAQMLADDREEYIQRLIEKVDSYEAVYKEEYAEAVKVLGNKILSVSDAQNAGAIQRLRHIQMLIDEIKELQDEVSTLRKINAENETQLRQYKVNRRAHLFRTESGPDGVHYFAEVDITQLDRVVKDLHVDNGTAQKLVRAMMAKFRQICSEMAEKSTEAVQIYTKHYEKADLRLNKLKQKTENLRKKYEEVIIPQIQQTADNNTQTLKGAIEQRDIEIDVLKETLEKRNNEIKELQQDKKQALQLVDGIQKQRTTLDEEMIELKEQFNMLVSKNKDYEKHNLDLKKEVSKLQRVNDKLTEQNETYAKEVEHLSEKNNEMGEKLLDVNRELRSTNKQLEQEKNKAVMMNNDIEENKKDMGDLKQRLQQAAISNRELESQNKTLKYQNQELADKIRELEASIGISANDNQELVSKLSRKSADYRELQNQAESQIAQLQDEIRQLNKQIQKLTNISEEKQEAYEQLSNKHDMLNQEFETLNRQYNTYKNDFKNQLSTAEMARKDILEELEDIKEQLANKTKTCEAQSKQISEQQKVINEQKWKINELSDDIKDKITKIEETKRNISDLVLNQKLTKDQEIQLQGALEESNKQTQELQRNLRKTQRQLEEKEQTLQEAQDKLTSYEEENQRLNDDIRELKSKLSTSSESSKVLQNKLDEITEAEAKKTMELSNIFANCNVKNVQDAIKQIKKLSNDSNTLSSVREALNIGEHEDVVKRTVEASQKIDKLDQIVTNIGSADDVVRKTRRYKDDQVKIAGMLNAKSDEELSPLISDLLEKKKVSDKNLDESNKFIADLLTVLSGSHQSPHKIGTHLSSKNKENIINSMKQTVEQSLKDRADVDNILKKAQSFGYLGKDVQDAVQVLTNKKVEEITQGLQSDMVKQISDINAILQLERETSAQEKEKLTKKIMELRQTISLSAEKNAEERNDYERRITELDDKNRLLSDQLETEKILRQELNRIGQGAAADKSLLRSKLSAQEFKVINFVEKIMSREREAAALRESLKRAREENLAVDTSNSV